jgi:hypothetical protein
MTTENDWMFDKRKQQMKKLPALFVILIMLGICTSSYGYFLVYNLSSTVYGIDDTNIYDTNLAMIPFKGYLVMDFNDDNSLIDANMILYGRDPNNHKVYVQLNSSDSNEFLYSYVLERGNVRNFYGLNGRPPFDFNSFMMGDVRDVNIGLANRRPLAPSLKGGFTGERGIFFSLNQKFGEVGNISASLYTFATKTANGTPPQTQDNIINELTGILADKQYSKLSIPAP